MTQKDKVSEILVIAGIIAFAYYKYSRLTQEEKDNIARDIKEIGNNILKEMIPEPIKPFLPTHLQ